MAWLLPTPLSPSATSALHQTALRLPASLYLAGKEQAGLAGECSAPPFQDNNGVIGLLEPMKKSMVPVQVQLSMPVVKVASGGSGVLALDRSWRTLFWALQTSSASLPSSHSQETTTW